MADLGKTPRHVRRILILALTTASAGQIASSQTLSQPPNASVAGQALVNRFCAGCHSAKLRTGGLALEGLDISHVSDHADVWEKVLQKVHSGEMPPRGLPRPAPAEYA